MTLRLNGSTSGYTEIDAPAAAGNNTLVLPTGNGSADQVIATNGSGALSFVDRGRMVLETAQASTSGTSVDFTGIPSWVKKISVMLQDISTNGTSLFQVQVGSGSVTTSGYAAQAWAGTSSGGVVTSGIPLDATSHAASYTYSGILFLCLLGSNRWAASGQLAFTNTASNAFHCAGSTPSLSGALDRVRITTIGGTDTFDAGSINILYEG